MDWLTQHSAILNLAINVGMLAVWILYLQLFLFTFLRSRKPRILINRGKGADIDALCLVSNMSQEPIYPLNVYFTMTLADGSTCQAAITDRDLLRTPEEEDPPRDVTSHGPLNQGDFISIGSFRHMIELSIHVSDSELGGLQDLQDKLQLIEVMVTGAFGGDDLEVAAKRTFRVVTNRTPWMVVPTEPQTRQIFSRRDRRRIRRMTIAELARYGT